MARSTDAGVQWTVRAVAPPAFTGVATAGTRLVASSYCLPRSAGGQPLEPAPTSCLFASEDGALTWRDLDVGPLVDPTFLDASYGWAHEQFPNGSEISETFDGGLSWSVLGAPCPADRPLLYRAVVTGRQTGYVLCLGEPTDAGQTWSLLARSPSGTIVSLFEGNMSSGEPRNGLNDEFVRGFSINPAGSGLMWTSNLYKTTDGGRSWSQVPTPGFEGGGFGEGGFVIDADNAYLVWGTTSSASILQYRSGILRNLVTWPWSIIAAGPALPMTLG